MGTRRHSKKYPVPAGLALVLLIGVAFLHPLAVGAQEGAEHPVLEEEDGLVCADCHEAPGEAKSVHPPAADGDCEICHEIVASGDSARVVPTLPGEELCLMCHADQEEELLLPHPHGVIRQLGCAVCHDPHESAHSTLLRREGNALCLECHAGSSRTRSSGNDRSVLLFDRRSMEAEAFDAIPKLVLPDGAFPGHPVSKHPVGAARDPLRPDRTFWCGSCHAAHGSASKNLLNGSSGFSFCRQCHQK